jgi:hypothetical protein
LFAFSSPVLIPSLTDDPARYLWLRDLTALTSLSLGHSLKILRDCDEWTKTLTRLRHLTLGRSSLEPIHVSMLSQLVSLETLTVAALSKHLELQRLANEKMPRVYISLYRHTLY